MDLVTLRDLFPPLMAIWLEVPTTLSPETSPGRSLGHQQIRGQITEVRHTDRNLMFLLTLIRINQTCQVPAIRDVTRQRRASTTTVLIFSAKAIATGLDRPQRPVYNHGSTATAYCVTTPDAEPLITPPVQRHQRAWPAFLQTAHRSEP